MNTHQRFYNSLINEGTKKTFQPAQMKIEKMHTSLDSQEW